MIHTRVQKVEEYLNDLKVTRQVSSKYKLPSTCFLFLLLCPILDTYHIKEFHKFLRVKAPVFIKFDDPLLLHLLQDIRESQGRLVCD